MGERLLRFTHLLSISLDTYNRGALRAPLCSTSVVFDLQKMKEIIESRLHERLKLL